MTINNFGEVAIGCVVESGYHLVVYGKVGVKEVFVNSAGNWPDNVFADNYILSSLSKIESYYKKYKRLPDYPSAKEVETNGQAVGAIQVLQQKSIEEILMYIVEQEKRIERLEKRVAELEH